MPKAFFCDQAKAKAFAKHHKTLFCDGDFCKAKRAHAESSFFRERFLLKEERAHAESSSFCERFLLKEERAHAESSSFRERFLLKEERAHARGRARTVERTKRPDNSDSF
ncbi:MAG: hypothetical protein PHF68_00780 [Candidatus ainarchaeum sp.]|nr:hypothetical protein [Candidatus ainarchaeum sp.]